MERSGILCLILAFLVNTCFCDKNDKVLVIVDSTIRAESHSIFIHQLQQTGFQTTVKNADNPGLVLKRYGEFLYDHIVLLAPTIEEFGGEITPESFIEFVDNGGNLILTADIETGDAMRDIASEVGVEIDESGNSVIDHFNFDSKDEGNHVLVTTSPENLIKSERIVGKSNTACLYRGTGLATDSSNPLIMNILVGSSTSYSHNPQQVIQDYPHAVGKNTVLIAGLQARNNARVLVLGSIDFVSDQFLTSRVGSEVSGNGALSAALVKWCFKQSGVIKIDLVQHANIEKGSIYPSFYTIREECEFTVKMSELRNGEWVPFQADDVQLEFVRIDPFIRKTMTGSANGVFTARFVIPDVYGVFKFVVNYARLGLTSVYSSNQISVHPLRHNQYERFIYSAYPYYASAFSMMAGVFIFSVVFLNYKEPDTKPKKE